MFDKDSSYNSWSILTNAQVDVGKEKNKEKTTKTSKSSSSTFLLTDLQNQFARHESLVSILCTCTHCLPHAIMQCPL